MSFPFGSPVFPSLRTLCLHRVAYHSSNGGNIESLHGELREEISYLLSACAENMVGLMVRRGDVWMINENVKYSFSYLMREAVISGHEWAIEYILRIRREGILEDDTDEEESSSPLFFVAWYGAIFRRSNLIERYLPNSSRDDPWFSLHSLERFDREVGLTLLAIMEEDVEVLKRTPFPRDTESINGLVFFAGSHDRLRSLEYLLTFCIWIPENRTITRLLEKALEEDNLELFQVLQEVLQRLPNNTRSYYEGSGPLNASLYRARRIFYAYLPYIEKSSVPFILARSRDSVITRELIKKFPSMDLISILYDTGVDEFLPAGLLGIMEKTRNI